MDKLDIASMISETEKQNSIFTNKVALDSFLFPSKIIGRNRQASQLVRYLLGYKQGYVVPWVSVYGRSGSGKSVTVRFVCENISDILHVFVNLRKAKTVFGAANLILGELGFPSLKSSQGINTAIEQIGQAIESKMQLESKNLLVLVLDEYDVLFYDKRGKPSDFVYKLLVLEENLRKKGYLFSVVSISNNMISDYDLDDRILSRIGSSEIFFEPYSKDDVLKILKERSAVAFSKKIDDKVLQYCAQLASEDHGDARRAIDLLRVSAETAGMKNHNISKEDVEIASKQLQKDRIDEVITNASFHFRIVLASLARLSYLTGEQWHSTSSIFNQYCMILGKERPLSYRRISGILTDIQNSGFTESSTASKGRHGYGTSYKLKVPPEMVGTVFPQWWKDMVNEKSKHDLALQLGSGLKKNSGINKLFQSTWDSYVGE